VGVGGGRGLMVARLAFVGQRYVLIVALLLLWQLSVDFGFLIREFLPSPKDIVMTLFRLTVEDRSMWVHFASSMTRLLWGVVISVAIGIPLGIGMGWSRTFARLTTVLVEITRPIPPIAMIPVGIFYLGIGDSSKVFIIWLACFFPLLLNTIAGIKATDPLLVKAARTLGAKTPVILLKIALPSAFPYILTGFRVSVGIGLMVLVAAEMVAATSGLGFFILQSQMTWKLDEMYAGIAMISLTGFAINSLLLRVEHRLLHWSQRSS
jgi:NitT/TauT family transport system permease protein